MKQKTSVAKILLILFISSIAALIAYGYFVSRGIEKNGIVTVGKYVFHKKLGKHQTNTFRYYIKGQPRTSDGGKIPDGFEKNIGKFYEISYDPNVSHLVIVNFENEITDKIKIREAGFSAEEAQ